MDLLTSSGQIKASKPILWTHANPDSTRMAGFMKRVNEKYSLNLKTYKDLYEWSIGNTGHFWGDVWDFTGVVAEKGYHQVSLTFFRTFSVM